MATIVNILLQRSDSTAWGFRLMGGRDYGTPVCIHDVSNQAAKNRIQLIENWNETTPHVLQDVETVAGSAIFTRRRCCSLRPTPRQPPFHTRSAQFDHLLSGKPPRTNYYQNWANDQVNIITKFAYS